MKTYIEPTTSQVWQFEDDVGDVFVLPGTPKTLIPHVIVLKVKTQAELEQEASNTAKTSLAKLRDDTYPDVLIFLATLTGAPKVIKDAAIVAAAEKAKVKP